MTLKQAEFDSYYNNNLSHIKWFEPFIQNKMLDEWNNQSIKPGMWLLDIGGGCSLDSIFYSSNGIHTVVLDFAKNALNKLKKLADFFDVDLEYENTSILSVPERLFNKFDILTDNGCFHHIDPEDRLQYISSVSRLLKKGGILYIRAISEYVPPSTDNVFKAYRITSDDILRKEFLDEFKLVEMSLFDYIFNPKGRQKMWFIKLQKR
jgi:cyclopropane fatty-acyl-phospholipid synthase-like methyltransferase